MLRRHHNSNQTIPAPSRSKLYESDSEDEEDLDDYEEEQERLLSEAYGEAEEGPGGAGGGGNKNTTGVTTKLTDAEIESALNREGTKQKNAKRRIPVLDCKTLTGPKGLIKIRHEFRSYKYRPPKQPSTNKKVQWERNVQAAANYLSTLMRAYQDFATTLCPSEHHSDTFYKIHQLGSKKEIKDYLNSMREDMAREYLESIYGREKAEKYIHELEHGLKMDRSQLKDVMYDEAAAGAGTMRLAAMQSYTAQNDSMITETEHKSTLNVTTTENDVTPEGQSNASHDIHSKDQQQEESDEEEFEMDFHPENNQNNSNETEEDPKQTLTSESNEESDKEEEFELSGEMETNEMTGEQEDEDQNSSNVNTDRANDENFNSEINENHGEDKEDEKEEDNDMFMRLGQTQDTMIYDVSQTQQTQDTLIMDSTQNFTATQETLVETLTPTQDALMEGSQDY
jgi:hypothetical protein